jgi:hypothetical protein
MHAGVPCGLYVCKIIFLLSGTHQKIFHNALLGQSFLAPPPPLKHPLKRYLLKKNTPVKVKKRIPYELDPCLTPLFKAGKPQPDPPYSDSLLPGSFKIF